MCRLCLKYMPRYLRVILWVLFESMKLIWKVIMHNDVTGCVTFISNKTPAQALRLPTRRKWAQSGYLCTTHVKISQLVASLQTSRQQIVFARLVTSCQQVWNKLLTTCNNLVDIIRLVTRLFQQGCYNHDITILLQPCVFNLVTSLLYHDCIRLVRTTL